MLSDEFEDVCRDDDPLRRARRATDLLARYQERMAELARLRREAIEALIVEGGLSLTAIATELGLTKGRITQIRRGVTESSTSEPFGSVR